MVIPFEKDETSVYKCHMTHITRDEWMELHDLLDWIGDNATSNGRIHFEIDGGVLNKNNGGKWAHVKIRFTNDTDSGAAFKGGTARADELAFKLRWM